MLNDSQILTTGLTQGYTGNTQIDSVERGIFQLKSSTYNSDEGTYIDQWLNASTGGGQELAESSDGTRWTRLYAGGVVSQENLIQLGITEKKSFPI